MTHSELEEGAESLEYSKNRRSSLGGPLPLRKVNFEPMSLPNSMVFSVRLWYPREQKVSTTMAFVRMLRNLMKSEIGGHVVPIIPDEGRTFGMDPLFSEFGIYSQVGQKYTPVDHKMLMNYKEARTGQILQEGSLRLVQWPHGPQRRPLMPMRELRQYHSTPSIPCSDSSE